MNHADHVRLLRAGIHAPAGVWADFGAGRGAFTLALADLLQPGAVIHVVDQDSHALRAQQPTLRARFPQITAHYHTADFTHPLELPPLDGIVMANALHFVQRKERVLALLRAALKPGGRLILVEYNTAQGNRWVPYPLTYSTWTKLATAAGFAHTELIATAPSSFLGEFFAACSTNP